MKCKICNSKTEIIFKGSVLKNKDVCYFHCRSCGFLQTEEPFWMEEAYADPVSILDTGMIQRNMDFANISSLIISFMFNKKNCFLDFAGGYGVFTRMMRDIGFDYYWDDKYTQNLFARGFEKTDAMKDFELVTAFEIFEHFLDPVRELEKMLSLSRNILFSTRFLPDPVPKPGTWTYYAPESGQHVSFYSYKTLKYIADKYNLNLCSNKKNFHLLSRKKISNMYFLFLLYLSQAGFYKITNKSMKSRTLQDCEYLYKTLNK